MLKRLSWLSRFSLACPAAAGFSRLCRLRSNQHDARLDGRRNCTDHIPLTEPTDLTGSTNSTDLTGPTGSTGSTGSTTKTYDFVIIGSGFGGSVSALRLAEKGYSVAVLETGRRYRDEDFPKTNWNIFKSIWLPVLRCFGFWRISFLSDVMILNWAGVGGGSLGYANTLLEPPDEFFENPQWAGMNDWKSALTPHFRTAKKMLGVTRINEPTPADAVMQKVAVELGCGHTFKYQDVGVFFGEPEKTVPDPYFDGRGPDRTGCRLCGGCMVGCRYNSKNTLVKNYLYLAEKLGAEVFPETEATLIHEDDGGYRVDTIRSTAVIAGRRTAFRCRQLVIAAGVLGTMRLLLRCREKGALTRLSPMLGARVRTNSESLTGATARKKDVDYSQGVAITSSIYPDAVTHIEPVRFPAGSDLLNLLVATIYTKSAPPLLRPLKWIWAIVRHPLDYMRTLWPLGWARRTVILLVMQTLENSVRVYRKRRWWRPFHKGLVSQREADREKIPACIPQAQTAAKVLAEKMNGIPQNAINEVLLNIGTTAHILGGCAIGPDPRSGVIDGQNRVYGYKGMYVVDGSMIPANLGVNPSLTITAMAEHAMSHIPSKER